MNFFWKRNKTQRNRRRKDRIAFHFPIKLLVPSLASIRGEGYVEVKGKNISEGGILVETSRSYPKWVPCRIKLGVLAHPEGIILEGMIIWADENKKMGSWEVGISFVNMREEHRNILQQMILQSK